LAEVTGVTRSASDLLSCDALRAAPDHDLVHPSCVKEATENIVVPSPIFSFPPSSAQDPCLEPQEHRAVGGLVSPVPTVQRTQIPLADKGCALIAAVLVEFVI
jgi:hypothetical protein